MKKHALLVEYNAKFCSIVVVVFWTKLDFASYANRFQSNAGNVIQNYFL